MKTRYTFILILLMTAGATAQNLIIDSVFATNGLLRANIGEAQELRNLIVQPDGMILACGDDYNINANDYHINLVRFDFCGELDTAFGDSGYVHVKFDQRNRGFGFNLQSDGKILVAGLEAPSNAGSQQIPCVVRINADGSPDTTFNGDGSHALRFDGISSGQFHSVQELSDGKIVCVGKSSGNINGGTNGVGAMRFLTDGSLDPTFSGDGIARQDLTTGSKVKGYIQQSGRIVAVTNFVDGSFLSHFFATAFDSTGGDDMTYAGSGSFTDSVNIQSTIHSVMQPDEMIVMSAQRDPVADGLEVIRIMSDGTLDPSFGTNGHVNLQFPTIQDHNGLSLLPDGSLLVTGNLPGNHGYIIKLDGNGNTDTTFGTMGMLTVPQATRISSVVELANGQLLTGGYDSDFLINRLTTVSNAVHVTQNGFLLTASGNGSFQWFLDSLPLSGATSDTLTAQVNGVYQVMMTDSAGCTMMSEGINITNVAVDAIDLSQAISVWPVPFEGELTVEVELKKSSAINMRIADVLGRIVQKADLGIRTGRVRGHFTPGAGVFFLTVEIDGMSFSKKIIGR